jgi:biopolymer transport protein ExbD
MRIAVARAPRYESGPNMTPLVDVVMVILIFLMLAGSFASNEHFVVSKMPINTGTSTGTPISYPGRMFDVYVPATEDGAFVASAGHLGRFNDPEKLKAALHGQKAAYDAEGIETSTVTLVIHPGTGAPWGPVIAAYDAALRAGFKNVNLARNH